MVGLFACSHPANSSIQPDSPPKQGSTCYVGSASVGIYITIPTTFERHSRIRKEDILWSIICGKDSEPPECEGSAVAFVNGEVLDTYPVNGAIITAIDGMSGTIQWRENVFTVNAANGTVTFRGPATYVGVTSGYGHAKCERYGAPTEVEIAR